MKRLLLCLGLLGNLILLLNLSDLTAFVLSTLIFGVAITLASQIVPSLIEGFVSRLTLTLMGLMSFIILSFSLNLDWMLARSVLLLICLYGMVRAHQKYKILNPTTGWNLIRQAWLKVTNSWTPVVFLILSFIVILINALDVPLAKQDATFVFSQDKAWQLGNSYSFDLGFPPHEIHLSGLPFQYHYLNELTTRGLSHLMNQSQEFIFLHWWPFVCALFLFMATFSLCRYFYSTRAYSLTAAFVLFFCSCLSAHSSNYLGSFLNTFIVSAFQNLNSVALGLGLMVAATELALRVLSLPQRPWAKILILTFTQAVLTWVKGPFGLLYFVGLSAHAVISAYKNKSIKPLFFSVFQGLAFLVIFKTFLSSGSSTLAFKIASTPLSTGSFPAIEHAVWSVPFHLFIIPVFLVAYYPVHLLFSVRTLGTVFRQKILTEEPATFLSIIGTGILMGTFLGHPGESQLYFLLATMPFLAILAAPSVHELFFSKTLSSRPLHFILIAIISISTLSAFKKMILLTKRNVQKYELTGCHSDGISALEREGLTYLKEVSSPRSIFTSNRTHISEGTQSRYFYFTAFSGRQAFVEGTDYSRNYKGSKELLDRAEQFNQTLYKGLLTGSELKEFLEGSHISFIVMSHCGPNIGEDVETSEFIRQIYKNPNMTIFEVLH